MVIKVQKRSYTWSRLIKLQHLWDFPQKNVWQAVSDRISVSVLRTETFSAVTEIALYCIFHEFVANKKRREKKKVGTCKKYML